MAHHSITLDNASVSGSILTAWNPTSGDREALGLPSDGPCYRRVWWDSEPVTSPDPSPPRSRPRLTGYDKNASSSTSTPNPASIYRQMGPSQLVKLILKRDAEIAALKNKLASQPSGDPSGSEQDRLRVVLRSIVLSDSTEVEEAPWYIPWTRYQSFVPPPVASEPIDLIDANLESPTTLAAERDRYASLIVMEAPVSCLVSGYPAPNIIRLKPLLSSLSALSTWIDTNRLGPVPSIDSSTLGPLLAIAALTIITPACTRLIPTPLYDIGGSMSDDPTPHELRALATRPDLQDHAKASTVFLEATGGTDVDVTDPNACHVHAGIFKYRNGTFPYSLHTLSTMVVIYTIGSDMDMDVPRAERIFKGLLARVYSKDSAYVGRWGFRVVKIQPPGDPLLFGNLKPLVICQLLLMVLHYRAAIASGLVSDSINDSHLSVDRILYTGLRLCNTNMTASLRHWQDVRVGTSH